MEEAAARQQALSTNGASELKKIGVHHYGLACDIVRDVGGEPSWKGDWEFLGRLARANGMVWGGDWGKPGVPHSFVDAVHVQRCTVARQAALFAGTWYPDDAYDPYADGAQKKAAMTQPKPARAQPAARRTASPPKKKP